MQTNDRILLTEDSKAIELKQASLTAMQPYVTTMVNEFNALEVGTIKTADLMLAYQNPAEFYNQGIQAMDTPKALKGLRLNKEKLAALMDFPDPSRFYSAAQVLAKLIIHQQCSVSDFVIDDSGNVIVDQAALAAYKETCRVYVETDDELTLYNALTAAAGAIETVRAAHEAITGKSLYTTWDAGSWSHNINQKFYAVELKTFSNNIQSTETSAILPDYDLLKKAKQKRTRDAVQPKTMAENAARAKAAAAGLPTANQSAAATA